jgi:hypothetical protein
MDIRIAFSGEAQSDTLYFQIPVRGVPVDVYGHNQFSRFQAGALKVRPDIFFTKYGAVG